MSGRGGKQIKKCEHVFTHSESTGSPDEDDRVRL